MSDARIDDDRVWAVIEPKNYADDSVHEGFRWLRANNPLGRAELPEFDPFWIVTKHADILEVSRQNDLFHNGDLQTTLTPKAVDEKVRAMTGGSPHLVRSLVQMDPPDHPKYRILTQAWFLPQNIRKLEDRIRQIARAHVDRMADMGGECDFVNDVALTFPLRVIMEILGVPESDEPRMLKLTQELFGSTDPDLNRGHKEMGEDFEANLAAVQSVIGDFFSYFDAITQDRRAHPTDDLATLIANGQIDGQPLGGFEAMSYYVIVATAGPSPPSQPPPFSASAIFASGTCRAPHRPRSWSTSSVSWAQPVAPIGWPRLSSPPPGLIGTRPPSSVSPARKNAGPSPGPAIPSSSVTISSAGAAASWTSMTSRSPGPMPACS